MKQIETFHRATHEKFCSYAMNYNSYVITKETTAITEQPLYSPGINQKRKPLLSCGQSCQKIKVTTT